MNRVIKRLAALVLLVAAFAAVCAPVASARLDLNPPSANDSAQFAGPAPAPATPVTETSDGFRWGDAALGAALTLAAVAVAAGGLVVSRRSHEQPLLGEAGAAK